jgi:hypothetical protein
MINNYKKEYKTPTKGNDYFYIHEENFDDMINDIFNLITKDRIKLLQELRRDKND